MAWCIDRQVGYGQRDHDLLGSLQSRTELLSHTIVIPVGQDADSG
jgi:hypothetical protein